MNLTQFVHRRRRTLRTAAAFGLSSDYAGTLHDDRRARLASAGHDLLAALPAGGGVALISGPSGSGKSTFLKLIVPPSRARPLRCSVHWTQPARLQKDPRPVAELSRLPLDRWLRLLAAFGLAEAPLLLTPAKRLSSGQQYRLALALAAARVPRTSALGGPCLSPPHLAKHGAAKAQVQGAGLILADEFCSLLDRPTAFSIAGSVRRWVTRHPGVRFIAGTAHDDLEAALRPDAVLSLDDHAITLATRT